MSSLAPGDSLFVHITNHSRIADGLCMSGFTNVSGIHVQDAPDVPIHVHGDIEIDSWYQVTISEVRPANIIAEADHLVDGRTGNQVVESESSSGKVWWVDTAGAECFHNTRSCDMVAKREGELLSVEYPGRNEPLPDAVSDMRRCNHCY